MGGTDEHQLESVVEQQLSANGWETHLETINEDFSLVTGVDPASRDRKIVLVAPSRERTIGQQEIEWISDRAAEVDANSIEVTTNGTVAQEAYESAQPLGVTIQDPGTYGQPQPQHQTAGQGHQSGQAQQLSDQPPQQTPGQQPPPQGGRHNQNAPPQRGQSQPYPQQSGSSSNTSADITAALKDGFRPIGGFIYGAISFVIAFVVTTVYFLYRLDQIAEGSTQILPDQPQTLGWAFYNAHMVDITFAAQGAAAESINYFDLINQIDPPAFYAIIGFILFLAGYSVASRVNRSLSTEASVVAGASVVVGYVPLLAAGSILVEVQENGATAGPELGTTLLLWGLIYAVVFGGLGGLVSGLRG